MASPAGSNMYAVYKQTHPPTAVEFCLYCNFFNKREKSLIVAGVNQLRVFRLTPDFDGQNRPTDKHQSPEDASQYKMKMECIQSYQLFGNIVSMQSVQLAGSQRDALLLSFQEAKLSVVEYDPGTHDLKTLSMHFFEDEDLKEGHIMVHQLPFVRVDPEGRCAVMRIYGTKIVVLPFRKDVGLEDVDLVLGSSGKAPVLASYTVNIKEIEERMDNIMDMQFLHGYYEPTLLILYEPLKTWPGRIAVRQDTFAMVAISLNIQQKVHPVIWSVNNLPFDCIQAFAVPRPIGGVVIFAVNSLMYLNQSIPPFGVSLNSIAEGSTAFPLKPQENLKISLDCAQASFISNDKLVISLKGGELYVLTLMVDGMRSVRSFNFDKAAASVLTTSMCTCEKGYLFLGSRLGNSLLLRYTEKILEESKKDDGRREDGKALLDGEEPPAKKKKCDALGDWMASDVTLIEDLDELEVYGNEAQESVRITSYVFEVCDTLLNIGPCGITSMGEPAFQSEEFCGSVDPDVELVTTSGYGKNGALSVLQRNVRPQVVTTFDLPGCVDMWTVVGSADEESEKDAPEVIELAPDSPEKPTNPEDADKDKEKADDTEEVVVVEKIKNTHSFLLLSRSESTMILQTGQEINELDHSGFSTQAPTIFAGNVGNNKYIIQVSPMGVRLLEGVKQLQHIPLDIGSPIVHASLADPYLTISGEEGQLILLTLRMGGQSSAARLAVSKPQIIKKSKILTVCLYKDRSGMFSISSKADMDKNSAREMPALSSRVPILGTKRSDANDEDELLYGGGGIPLSDSRQTSAESNSTSGPSNLQRGEVKATYWLMVARDNGLLEIYNLVDFSLAYLVKNFPVAPKVLVDSIQATVTTGAGGEKPNESMSVVKEIMLVGLGNEGSRPLLLTRIDDDLYIYEAFPFFETQTENHLKLRFRKVNHNMILRERKTHKSRKKGDQPEPTVGVGRVNQFRHFEDVAGYSGVFICGLYPHWLFLTARGELRLHPMNIDGAVMSFAPFHNVNCPKGFLYFNKQGDLRISVLPTHLSYDAPWPVRKVPLRCTPHFLNYHVESKTYCVVTSTSEPVRRVVKPSGEEKEFEAIDRDERFIYATDEVFSVQLFSPVSWEMIPNTKFDMEEFEHVTCMKNVSLSYEGARSGMKGYLALGSNYNCGEDVSSRGRIIIMDVIEVVPEPGQPLTKNRIKILYSKEQKGPVTALCHVVGYLLSCIGQKIYVWTLKDNDLVGVAFIDTQIYIHSAISIKNLILVADIFKSISLLRFQDEVRTLSLVGRDVKPLEVYGLEFFIDNSQIGLIVSDVDKNMILYAYRPEARESFGGQRLLRKGDFHVGSHVHTFFRIRCKLTDPSSDEISTGPVENRHLTMFATLDGSLGYFLPIPEKTYRRLLMLQNVLTTHTPHIAGLNPKAYRIHHSRRKFLMNPSKSVLDGDLLWKFSNLSMNEKLELAKKIGTTSEQVMEDLVEIDRQSAHF